MLVFGYGSLIWKADFKYEFKTSAFIRGYKRRFWQGSIDHRGTHEAPGRVVTLLPTEEWKERFSHLDETIDDEDDLVWGVVYKIAAEDVESVRSHLDHREKNGYSTYNVDVFHPSVGNATIPMFSDVLVYVADSSNESFLGPAPISQIAKIIADRSGPSGPNVHYLYGLTHSLKLVNGLDKHLIQLEAAVESYLAETGGLARPRHVVTEKDTNDLKLLHRLSQEKLDLDFQTGSLSFHQLQPILVMSS
ncbi:hypothetical protein SmJEL517_g04983 [Synchytrium microbalum]|uniref:glutathione-specific gamma-glutamylcyclotransferase n=1 Tax=Synchytrium microbalum TaxID=1806994 RepID=A0A507BXC9_9FUNG|nr:uncharacterized protein SmJEL517_g04983 [Synchytrium microbalum]TPX31788.1 hypothetical protein SmJEL517_g04983 [Synchytrium microbalum]